MTIEHANGEKLTGNYSIMATTLAQTEILSFTATAVSVTQAELNLIILDGPDPGSWTVSYTAEGLEPQTTTFSGHSTVIAGLQSGTEYTFTLQEPENTKLIGQTQATFSTVPTVSIVPPLSVAISSSSRFSLGTLRATRRRAGLSRSQAQTITPTRRLSPPVRHL